MKTKPLVFAAMMTALATAILAAGSLLPALRFGTAALAGLVVSMVLIRCGQSLSWLTFIAASAVSLLTLPHKFSALCFLIFLGWYPIVKWLCERLTKRLWEWLCKLAAFNAAMAVVYFVFTALLPEIWQSGWMLIALPALGNAVFVIYDFGLSQWIYKVNKLYRRRENYD
jgi:hypothetical protein